MVKATHRRKGLWGLTAAEGHGRGAWWQAPGVAAGPGSCTN